MSRITVMIILLWAAGICPAQTIYVDSAGPNDPGTGNYEDPFRKIQDAITAADNNDIIIVSPGIYTPNDVNGFNCEGKNLFIKSTEPNDPETVAQTIIDPDGNGRIFYFNSGEQPNCTIAGFTMTGGYSQGSGGAVYCIDSSPMFRNCVIIDNTSDWGGGAVYCNNSGLALFNCIIAANYAGTTGGAIRCVLSDALVVNCTIVGNSAEYSGGAMYSLGGVPLVANSIIWSNSLEQIHAVDETPVIVYSDIQGGHSGDGNIDADPCFAYFDENTPPDLWDLHLASAYGRWDPNSQSWTTDPNTSLCIDAGDPDSDYIAEPWPNGQRVNMGAYGNTSHASKNGNIADLAIDGKVDFYDFSVFAEKWMTEEKCIQNLDNYGFVDFADMSIFSDHWLWQQ